MAKKQVKNHISTINNPCWQVFSSQMIENCKVDPHQATKMQKKFQNFELGHKTPKNPIISMTTHFSRFFSSIVRGNRSKGLTVGWSRKNINSFDQNA